MSKLKNFVIFLIFFSFIFLLNLSHAYAWLEGFNHRRAINITNSGSTALTDYQVLITLNTQTLISQGKMRSDCGDIRFALANNTLLSYWIESGCNTNSTSIWVRVPSIPANSNITIYLYYGNPSVTSLSDFSLITPSYIGREFYSTCLSDVSFRIVSYDDNNTITIYRSDTWSLVASTTLNRFGTHSYYCNSNNPFFINSTRPISVTYDNILPSGSSDDDFTSVYTDKIWIRVPRHLWICSYDNNNFIRVQNSSLNNVWSGTLNEGECWFSGNLVASFYYINATHPVTAQFGLEDDNVYGIVHGRTFPNGTQVYYFFSYGYTIVSSLYPNTSVRIENLQTGTGNWNGTLVNEGDHVRIQQITSFTSNAPEYVRMRVISNKPVIVYTEGSGNSFGSEQIPSINGRGAGTYFVFRVGWSFGSGYPRYIRIIGTEPATNVTISGCVSTSTTLTRGQQVEYSCGTSWGLVRINSTKPVLVFERDYYVGEEISIVLPYRITSPEPTTSIGVEETNYPPTITILLPTNTTYFYSNNFIFNFSVSDDRSLTFWIRAFLDGNMIYENVSYQNNTIITLTQNLIITKSYNFTVWANDTDTSFSRTSTLSVIFTIRDFEIQQIIYNVNVYETTQQNFIEVIRYNPDLVRNITSTLVWNSTNYQTSQTQNSTHLTFSSNIYIPLVQTNNTQVSFYFSNQINYLNGTSTTINSQTNQQNILVAYTPRVSLLNVILHNNTLYSNSTTFNFSYGNLTPFINPNLRFRVYANGSLVKDDPNLTFTFNPNIDSIYHHNFSIAFQDRERFFNHTTVHYIYTIIFHHSLNITFGFFTTTPQQTFNFSVSSPLAPYVNCSLLNIYNVTFNRTNYNVWYSYVFPVNQSPITLSFICRDLFNTNSSVYEYPIYIIKISPVDEELGIYNTSLWLDPVTNRTAIIRFVAISPNFNQSIISERVNQTMWLIVPTNTWIMTVQTLYSLQYFTQTYVLRDWTKHELPVCIPANKPQNLQTAYTTTPLDWSFIVRRGDTGCVKVIDRDTNSLGNYFGFYFYTLPGLYTLSKLENGTEIFISALRGESENLVDLQKIVYQWKKTLSKVATIARISIVNILGGDNSTIVHVTTNAVDDYKLEIEKDNQIIYTQTFPDTSNFTLTLMWRSVGINPNDVLTFKLFGSNGLIYQAKASATGKIYKYSAIFTGIILIFILLITFLKPINIEKIFILSLVALFLSFYLIPQTEPSIYLNMLGFAIIALVASSGVIMWKTIR